MTKILLPTYRYFQQSLFNVAGYPLLMYTFKVYLDRKPFKLD